MIKDISLKDKPQTGPKDNLVSKLTIVNKLGWVLFFISLGFIMLQNIILTVQPLKVLAADSNGRVVGQVIFDESRYRSSDEILADHKKWFVNCVSLNKVTVYEDMSVCLKHMSEKLSEARLEELISTNYVGRVEQQGCVKTDYKFNSEHSKIKRRDRLGADVEIEMKGELICNDTSPPSRQDFYVAVESKLLPRTESHPLAIEVYNLEDVK